MDWISWVSWISGVTLGLLILGVIGYLFLDYFRSKDEPEIGATEDWADPDTGELSKIVKAISFDRDSEPTGEIDMEALHERLAIEDIQIDLKKVQDTFDKASAAVVDPIIKTLTDDVAWAAAIEARKARKINV